MLITISRQYGAGGSEVARMVAERLGWQVVDNEIVDLVARRAGLTREAVASRDERVPGFVERLAHALAVSSQEYAVPELGVAVRTEEPALVRITEMVVKEIAAEGRVVLVGRAAPAVIGQAPDALHVKLVAPRAFRVRVAMEAEGLDAPTAERRLEEVDAQRARYHRDHYGRDWDDPVHFHMVLNTGLLGFEGAAEVIVARARALGW
ncbi:MAG TPA: cytidylate kinase-like family protein [Gemmatimonadales bacterium]|jgi:cytidylate kinase|nr:cytidylate kinase-like family protein [Gemmatimonadales bacterium]